ncbi:ribosomal RNA small subunit methyltransferase NEP1-like [Pyrus ussuriensis x Pyrus communis]|uniref:Ribosomal RNA small subunit methyltransferase NEP1-like n=1 Tax=Pyrus ussuriensis x Pyrus communis TaxID=2448454 RepID=A0A5N5HHH0_9ROSA|nr:ribosomal RNA small subunit methyltransferase NEP1-like [Pyrus ussuriensis x Pyrus communis]
MARRKRRQSESESGAQDLSNKTVKRKLEEKSTTTEKLADNDVTHDAIIPSPPPNVEVRRATFVVENASLRKGIVRKRWKILDSEEDADALKQKKDENNYRPGVVYQALRAIFDSKLNKAGMVGAVYVKTDNGVLFEIKPHVRIPRTCRRFCGVMLELLDKKCIRTKDTNEILMRVIAEPVTRHLPVNSRVVGLSYSSEKVVDIDDYVNSAGDELNLVFVVGELAHGKINEYTNDFISVSNYPLSAKGCIGLICESLEHKWKVF